MQEWFAGYVAFISYITSLGALQQGYGRAISRPCASRVTFEPYRPSQVSQTEEIPVPGACELVAGEVCLIEPGVHRRCRGADTGCLRQQSESVNQGNAVALKSQGCSGAAVVENVLPTGIANWRCGVYGTRRPGSCRTDLGSRWRHCDKAALCYRSSEK